MIDNRRDLNKFRKFPLQKIKGFSVRDCSLIALSWLNISATNFDDKKHVIIHKNKIIKHYHC